MKHPVTHTVLKWAFINFFIAALLGLLLRLNIIMPLQGFNAKYWLHAHSHFAMAGWVFTALMGAILHSFVPVATKLYKGLFIAALVAAYGMLFSFPVKGYWWFSISFSTLYIVITYVFTYVVFRHTKSNRHAVSVKLLRAALVFLCVSSIGAFSLGPVMAMGKTGTPLYFNAIYFYLHFQYNGWFIPAIAALLFRHFETRSIAFSQPQANLFYKLLAASVVPLFFLSTLWSAPGTVFNLLSALGALLQLAALAVLVRLLKKAFPSPAGYGLSLFILGLAALKVLLQLPGSWQPVAQMAYGYRDFIIAFLHLIMLGIVSLFLIHWCRQNNLFTNRTLFTPGLLVYTAGFILTEGLMIARPFFAISNSSFNNTNTCLFVCSALLPAGVALLLLSMQNSLKNKRPFYPLL